MQVVPVASRVRDVEVEELVQVFQGADPFGQMRWILKRNVHSVREVTGFHQSLLDIWILEIELIRKNPGHHEIGSQNLHVVKFLVFFGRVVVGKLRPVPPQLVGQWRRGSLAVGKGLGFPPVVGDPGALLLSQLVDFLLQEVVPLKKARALRTPSVMQFTMILVLLVALNWRVATGGSFSNTVRWMSLGRSCVL